MVKIDCVKVLHPIQHKNTKRIISSAKEKKQKECANDLNDPKQKK